MKSKRPSALLNLGPKSDAMLASVGIHTNAELAARGAIDAFIALNRAGQPVSLSRLLKFVHV